jgi:lipoprotein-releasing system ATP-binding protein
LSASTAIRAELLTKRYRSGGSELTVFENLNFEVCQGDLVAIVGESGAGKSTLLHLLGGLDRPSDGKIYFGQQDLGSLSEKKLAEFRNQCLGFVWQSPSLLPEFTALENVMMPLLIRGVAPQKASATAMARLDEVGLRVRSTHRAGELSGGEQQRVALARALAAGPQVLLADEPTGSLDARTGEMIVDLLVELHRSHHLTSIFVTHNLSFAQRCDRVLELKKGSLATPVLPEEVAVGVVRDATRLDGGNYV